MCVRQFGTASHESYIAGFRETSSEEAVGFTFLSFILKVRPQESQEKGLGSPERCPSTLKSASKPNDRAGGSLEGAVSPQ